MESQPDYLCLNRLLTNYAMIERFLTTKKLYHDGQPFVKRFCKMLQIGALFAWICPKTDEIYAQTDKTVDYRVEYGYNMHKGTGNGKYIPKERCI